MTVPVGRRGKADEPRGKSAPIGGPVSSRRYVSPGILRTETPRAAGAETDANSDSHFRDGIRFSAWIGPEELPRFSLVLVDPELNAFTHEVEFHRLAQEKTGPSLCRCWTPTPRPRTRLSRTVLGKTGIERGEANQAAFSLPLCKLGIGDGAGRNNSNKQPHGWPTRNRSEIGKSPPTPIITHNWSTDGALNDRRW